MGCHVVARIDIVQSVLVCCEKTRTMERTEKQTTNLDFSPQEEQTYKEGGS